MTIFLSFPCLCFSLYCTVPCISITITNNINNKKNPQKCWSCGCRRRRCCCCCCCCRAWPRRRWRSACATARCWRRRTPGSSSARTRRSCSGACWRCSRPQRTTPRRLCWTKTPCAISVSLYIHTITKRRTIIRRRIREYDRRIRRTIIQRRIRP